MPWYIVFKLQKTKDNKKILKEARKKNTLPRLLVRNHVKQDRVD